MWCKSANTAISNGDNRPIATHPRIKRMQMNPKRQFRFSLAIWAFMSSLCVQTANPCPMAADGAQMAEPDPCRTVGELKTAVILARFPGVDVSQYLSPEEIGRMVFATEGPSLDHYIRATSYGRTWLNGRVLGWYTLDRSWDCLPESDPGYNRQQLEIEDAVLRAAATQVDVGSFNRFLIIMPIGHCKGSFGGNCWNGRSIATYTGSAFQRSGYSMNPRDTLALLFHEFGHTLGLRHAKTEDFGTIPLGPVFSEGVFKEYGSQLSVMGSPGFTGQFNAPERAALGWLTPGTDYISVQSPGVYSILPLDTQTAGLKALRIMRDKDSGAWLWLEYRQPTGVYDVGFPATSFTGAVVHNEDPSSPQWLIPPTRLLDFTPSATPNDFGDAPLRPGATWRDPYSPLVLRVTSTTAAGLTVEVNYDTPCVQVDTSTLSHGKAAQSGSLEFQAPAGCLWTAKASADWIKLVPPLNGAGGGTLRYEITQNATKVQRRSAITLGKRVIVVAQAADNSPPVAVSLSPARGAGYQQTFSLAVSDDDGSEDLVSLDLFFDSIVSTARCYIKYSYNGRLSILSDDQKSTIGPVWAGQSGTIENSSCLVDAATVSAVRSGKLLTLKLSVTFKAAFEGLKLVYLAAQDLGNASTGWQLQGLWYVGLASDQPEMLTTVSAASYISGESVAPDSIVAGFGQNLAPSVEVAPPGTSLPQKLGGVSVRVKSVLCSPFTRLWFVSPSQINFLVPSCTGVGPAAVVVESGGRPQAAGIVDVRAVSPALFSAEGNGKGVASAVAVHVRPDESQNWEYLFEAGCVPGACKAAPIDLGLSGEQVVLSLYGTGIRGRTALSAVSATIGGLSAPVQYAGPVEGYTGLDQVNIVVPRLLAGRGLVQIILTVDGKPANPVDVHIR